jgi:hypothetical protein
MLAQTAGEPGSSALVIALLVLFLLLAAWNIWLNTRLRQARSLHEELHALVGRRLGDRLDADDPSLARALEDAFRDRLPDLIKQEVESPSSPLHAALEHRITRLLERGDDAEMSAAVQQQLLGRVTTMFAEPGEFEGLFDRIDTRLGESILARVEASADDSRVAAVVGERVLARVEGMFENPDDFEGLFSSLDEKLGERVLRLAGKLPEETAARMDATIRDALVAQVAYIFDNPDDYESLVETIDEGLGQRITRLLGHPSPELQQALEGPARAGLAGRMEAIFASPDDYEDLIGEVDELLGKRIDRRLREELAKGSDGLIEQLLVEALRERVRGRLDGRRESLDLSIDTRITKHQGEGTV